MCAFFARPNIENTQFKQLISSELTLSGQTQIATTSGLTLTDGVGGGIIITASGASVDNQVLTYDAVENIIKLKDPTASGGTGVYPYPESATTTVGGLPVGQDLYNELVVDILHDILVPTVPPGITDFSSSLSVVPSDVYYEVGCSLSLTGTSSFYRGFVEPQYCGSCCYPAGLPYAHEFNLFDFGGPTISATTSATDFPTGFTRTITYSDNILYSRVHYLSGDTPTYNSSSGVTQAAVLAGATPSGDTGTWNLKKYCGIYPWYWGTDAVAPDVSTSGCTQCLIDSYTDKCVGVSTNDITVDNFSVTGEYLWFAIPTGSTKASWQGANNVSNNGFIPGTLFPSPTTSHVVSPDGFGWGVSPLVGYEIYVSNYATDINYGMTFSN